MKTTINHQPEVDQGIDDWIKDEKNQTSLERLQGMTKEQLVRTCVNSWIRNDSLEQRQSHIFRREVDRFVEHSPKTQEKIMVAIRDKPEVDHYKIARGIANRSYHNARTFQAGQEQGKGAKFMERFQRNATEQTPAPAQEQAVAR